MKLTAVDFERLLVVGIRVASGFGVTSLFVVVAFLTSDANFFFCVKFEVFDIKTDARSNLFAEVSSFFAITSALTDGDVTPTRLLGRAFRSFFEALVASASFFHLSLAVFVVFRGRSPDNLKIQRFVYFYTSPEVVKRK